MGLNNTDGQENYFRLVAFWAVCEAFAGGILHAVKMPFTGLSVSSLAVLCIILIAYQSRGRMMILKATLLVCIFKFLLSPHTPPTAFIAVGFQGLAGQLIFAGRFNRAGAIILGALALVESSIQRILVLLFIYGVSFWDAVNTYIQKTVGSGSDTDYLYMMALGYIAIHLIAGLFVGSYAYKLAVHSTSWRKNFPDLIMQDQTTYAEPAPEKRKKRKIRILMWVSFLILAGLYIQSKLNPESSVMPTHRILDIFYRAILILLSWYIVVSPLLMALLKKIFERGKSRYQEEIERISQLIPHMRLILRHSLRMSAKEKGFARLRLFLLIVVINITGD